MFLLHSRDSTQCRIRQLPAHLESDNGEKEREEERVLGRESVRVGLDAFGEGRDVDDREEEDLRGEETVDEFLELREIGCQFRGRVDAKR